MATTMVKGVALGGSGTTWPDPNGNANDYRYVPPVGSGVPGPSTAFRFADTGTVWIRFWMDLSVFFPTPTTVSSPHFDELERQLKLAKDNGLAVILTLWRYPQWMNAGSDLTWQRQGKDLEYRLPDDVSTSSPFADMITCILTAYSAGSPAPRYPGAVVDVLEMSNEANSMCWPQSDTNGVRSSGCKAAQMMQTALAISLWFGNQATAIAGPAAQDLVFSYASSTGMNTTTLANVSQTNAISHATDFVGFFTYVSQVPGTRAVFTMHNHDDITNQTLTVGHVREQVLRSSWKGWPYADWNDPHLWITEGGVLTKYIESRYLITNPTLIENLRAALIGWNYNRMKNNSADPDYGGVGIDLMMYYQFDTSPFDTGLCETLPTRANRPAYATWKSL